MDNDALSELLKQAELALLAFSTADKHLEQVEIFYLDTNASSIQMAKLCVEAAGAPLFKIVTCGDVASLHIAAPRPFHSQGEAFLQEIAQLASR